MDDIEATIRRVQDDNEKLRHCQIGLITMKPLIFSYTQQPMMIQWSGEALTSWEADEWTEPNLHSRTFN